MNEDLLGLRDGTNNGASEELKPQQSEPQQILASKGGSDLSPRLVTIQCSLEIFQPQVGPASVIGVRGFLDWGISGCSHKAEFDWIQGCTFTLAATSYKIRAKLQNTVVPGTKVFAKASTAYGTKCAVPLQLSTDYVQLANGANHVFDIPPWATHGLLVVTPFFVLPMRGIKIELLTFTSVVRYEVMPEDCTEADRFPVSADVQKVRVTNNSEDADVTVGIIWRLSL